jgi:hypothetical protein
MFSWLDESHVQDGKTLSRNTASGDPAMAFVPVGR